LSANEQKYTIILNFKKCPFCKSNRIKPHKQIDSNGKIFDTHFLECRDCKVIFARWMEIVNHNNFKVVAFNRRTDGTLISDDNSKVFIELEEQEVVRFT
jgi:hypothetical protein